MARPDSPCIKCERRGCGAYHDSCERFADYKEKNAQWKKSNSKHIVDNYIASNSSLCRTRMIKAGRWRELI